MVCDVWVLEVILYAVLYAALYSGGRGGRAPFAGGAGADALCAALYLNTRGCGGWVLFAGGAGGAGDKS